MAINIQLRRGNASEWTTANPTLALAELGIETDTDQFKIGDGATAWTALGYGGIVGPAGSDGADGSNGTNGGFDSTQVIETKSTSYTLTSADAGKLILNSDAITITVQGLVAGEQVDFLQNIAGQITFAAGAGMTLNSRGGNLLTSQQYSPAGVKCVATDTYVLVGDLGA
jgi:hypothetical protein